MFRPVVQKLLLSGSTQSDQSHTAIIDTLGFDRVVIGLHESTVAGTNGFITLKLGEGDTTSAFTDIASNLHSSAQAATATTVSQMYQVSVQICDVCKGTGSIKTSKGFFMMSQPCTACRGTGRKVTKVCTSCGGRGKNVQTETINVKIPRGVDTGSRVKLKGMGGTGLSGSQPGDLHIEITIRHHPI